MMLLLVGLTLAQQHVTLNARDGATVYADVYGKKSSSKGVVLAHGGQFNKESWEKQARILSDAGFRVIAFDFRGFGKSRGPGDSDMFKAPMQNDVLAAVRYLRKTGTRKVAVIGGSFGGWASADAVIAAKPGEIDKLILLGAGAGNGPPSEIKVPKLILIARDDSNGDGPRLPEVLQAYEQMPEPKRIVILDGSAHAQFLFQSDQNERVLREILEFLRTPR